MAGRSVHFARIHHHGVGARFHSRSKCREKVFAQSIFRDKRGASVSIRSRAARTHIVFQRSRKTVGARKITSRIPANGAHSHPHRTIRSPPEFLPPPLPPTLPPLAP